MNVNQNREIIVDFINMLVGDLSMKYPNMDFSNVRINAINNFANMTGSIDEIKSKILISFSNAERNLQQINNKTDNFEMTNEEQMIYEQLKQENLEKKNSMGLNNVKRLTLTRNTNFDNRGYINFLIIMGIVLVVIVSLIVIVCNVLV
jgi:hypothetical protein